MSGVHCRLSLKVASLIRAGVGGAGTVHVRMCVGRVGGGRSVSEDMERSMERRHPIPYSSKLVAHEYGGGMIEFAWKLYFPLNSHALIFQLCD